ncbi:MAG: 6-phosphogluconolactonase [Acidimicrobiia bacterium]|jgi:6-phosphogluconolactonase|nr:6-phosphogluconolactonase [Acidimicrobiia bacterium]
MFGDVQIVPHVPQAFAALVAATAPASIALSGGGTARECYELLATADVDWGRVDVWFGDERWLPVHDPESNEGMARVTFLDEVEPLAIHSMYDAGATIDAAADAYDTALRAAPALELVHLGLGPDGHTASLFPGSAALDEAERWVVPNADDRHPHRRLTLTLPGLATAKLVVFTVSGSETQDPFARIRRGDDLPAARVRAERVVWLVDESASAGT